ncbi:MAG: hypothetical protein IT342_25145 [Candidatus Melainabacteria bacterium]|nr:hypothetical protein [Candidatus Melainabacteria bacterium]
MEKTITASLPEMPFKGSFKILVTFTVLYPAAKADDPIDSSGNFSDSQGSIGLVDVSEVKPLIFDESLLDGPHSKLLCDIFSIKDTIMNSQNPAKTLREEIAEVIAAEQQEAVELAEKQRQEEA